MKPKIYGREQSETKLIISSDKNILTHPKPMLAGFFSYCSVYLNQIINHIKSGNQLANIKLGEFEFYQTDKKEKVYKSFFHEPSSHIKIIDKQKLNFPLYAFDSFYQKTDYLINRSILDRWFNPKKEIQLIKNNFIIDLSLKTNQTLSVYYRGLDNQKDRQITYYDIFVNKVIEILKNKKIKYIFLQTDDKMFEDYIINSKIELPIKTIKEIPSIYSIQGFHFLENDKIDHAKKMLASVLLMSECENVIANSSNVARWILLYRKQKKGFYQYNGNHFF